jgi:hypothetical protein
MAKVKILAKCFEVNVKEQGSSVSFVVPKAKQLTQGKIAVSVAVQIEYEAREAAQFEPGKSYTITIE